MDKCSSETTWGEFTNVELESKSSDSRLREDILNTVAKSDGFFKHQQRGDAELEFPEKRLIAEQILQDNPGLFLERYGKFLSFHMLKHFDKFSEDYEVQFHLSSLNKFLARPSLQRQNRRYEALKRLISSGDYFSDKEMRRRNPLLFEQMIGQYQTDQERETLDRSEDRNMSFSGLLMEHIERRQMQGIRRMQQAAEQEAFDEEMDSSSDDDDDNNGAMADCRRLNDDSEKNMLREEFVNIMYESFLSGKDDYDYGSIDHNVEYDSLDTKQQDDEEKYFDAEEPSSSTTGDAG